MTRMIIMFMERNSFKTIKKALSGPDGDLPSTSSKLD